MRGHVFLVLTTLLGFGLCACAQASTDQALGGEPRFDPTLPSVDPVDRVELPDAGDGAPGDGPAEASLRDR